jgi:hypothetical protein
MVPEQAELIFHVLSICFSTWPANHKNRGQKRDDGNWLKQHKSMNGSEMHRHAGGE